MRTESDPAVTQKVAQDGSPSNELWKAIPEFNDYEISSLGRVRALPRVFARTHYTGQSSPMHMKPKTMTPQKIAKGYWAVNLSRDGSHKKRYIHRLLMECFGPAKPFPGALVRHLDDNKENNALDNLAWGTMSDNANDAFRNGRSPFGVGRSTAKLNPEKAKYIRDSVAAGVTHVALSREFNVNLKTIYAVTQNKSWVVREDAKLAPEGLKVGIGRFWGLV